jgi:ABC-type glutathione transport system ATPase component
VSGSDPVLSIRRLTVAIGGKPVLAEVSLDLVAGETLGVVGRSGSGKSTLVLAIAGLLPRGAVREAGRFELRPPDAAPVDLRSAKDVDFARHRGRDVGVVFQEPEASLDPLFRIGDQVAEVLRAGGGVPWAEARRRTLALLAEAGLAPPVRFAAAYPSQLSGGENQRACVAAALALSPRILLADEPTSALDAAVATQVLDLLRSRTRSGPLATLLVTHDFDVVAAVADRVLVLECGRVVEEGAVARVLAEPREAATRELLAARIGAGR